MRAGASNSRVKDRSAASFVHSTMRALLAVTLTVSAVACSEAPDAGTESPDSAESPELPEANAAEDATEDAVVADAPVTSERLTEPQTKPQPEPAPEPAPFAGRETVTVDELLAALEAEVETIAASEAVRTDFEAFVTAFELEETAEALGDDLYLDYVRITIAFEATRDGGWWGLEWDITNEQPNSELVWAQWQDLAEHLPAAAPESGSVEMPATTAIAECDELSALFAFVAHRIGLQRAVSHAGLFWPTGNHTIAVWIVDPKGDAPTRVNVPTTQIFLESDATLGDRGFDPWRQKSIFDYRREDASDSLELPGALASYFVAQVRAHGPASKAAQLELRAQRLDAQLTNAEAAARVEAAG